ncbi:MAG: transglutaminase-like domain-containing protein [Spirochaetaceae bacterium]|jgi:hypothetical protein|nr:transglutaminase-like domain-containing protein [Spirochaetaceae bacterium]
MREQIFVVVYRPARHTAKLRGSRRRFLPAQKTVFAAVFAAYAAFSAFTADFYESFESGGLNKKLLGGNYEITGADKEVKSKDRALFDNDTDFVKLSAALDTTTTLSLEPLKAGEASVLTFRYRTEIDKRAQQSFTVTLDGAAAASYDGVGAGWRTARIPLAAGEHSVVFAASAKRTQVVNGYNAVYLDDIRLVPDKAVSLALFPAGKVDTYAGAEGGNHVAFTVTPLRSDGSPMEGGEAAQWTASGGASIAGGVFNSEREGAFTVGAKMGGLSVTSGTITVHPTDYLRRPYTYPGTGTTYAGFLRAAPDAPPAPQTASVKITAPTAAAFEADAFFTLEGSITKPKSRNYARIMVVKQDGAAEDTAASNAAEAAPAKRQTTAAAGGGRGGSGQAGGTLKTWYIVHGDFCRRVWLPFGPGRYVIEIQVFESAIVTSPPGGGEGIFRGGSYSEPPVTLTVVNTRAEAGVDGDARWIYPSFQVQADDFSVTNLMYSLTGGLKTERDKIAAVHDYIVSTTVYDQVSFSNPSRSRKMDAVSALANKTAVCEGYSNLSAALLRAAGIPVRIITSKAINHAWNNVYTGGQWLFYDATWDDPVPDRGPEVVSKTYFLLESLTGGGTRHGRQGKIMIGDLE